MVRLRNARTQEVFTEAGFGTGPVDAMYQGINRIVQVPNRLIEFSLKAVTEGLDAQADVTLRIEAEAPSTPEDVVSGSRRRRVFSGRGLDTDIVVASAKAYIQALNKLIATRAEEESTIAVVTEER